jgi:Holliday junction DNA helicase RuvA
MFNSIRGTLSEKRADSVCIETQGLEWEISVPARSVDDFGRVGGEARAFTWLHHYEDGMRLYGFSSAAERSVFLELMKVEGIGPKQALRVLSGIGPDALEAALEAEDLKALQKVPGVGPKLAQKMMLALKGKLVRLSEEPGKPGREGSAPPEWADLVRALADMGFDRRAVEAEVTRLSADIPPGPEKERELFKRSLLVLSGGA